MSPKPTAQADPSPSANFKHRPTGGPVEDATHRRLEELGEADGALGQVALTLARGGTLLAAGLLVRDERVVRGVVGVVGVAYLAVGLLGFVAPRLFGLVPHGYDTVLENLLHLTLGVLGMAIGFVIGSRSAPFTVR